MALKRGEFLIRSFRPAYTFIGEFGDGAPLPDGASYGGWTATAIPKRMALTEWDGRNPMVLPIEFLIDRLEEGDATYVESMRDRLDKIAATHSRDEEPPVCIFDSGGLAPHDYSHAQHVRWVVSALDWNRDLTINSESNRRPLRVGGTLTLMQYNHDDMIDSYDGPAKRNRDRHSQPSGRARGRSDKDSYIVKSGDSLTSIAARELGSSTKWREIADLNNIRNPRNLRVGQRLRLPK